MPNAKSAKKELRKNNKNNLKNKLMKANVKKLTKEATKAIQAQDKNAQSLITQAQKAVDKAVKENIYKKNTAARKKSSLQKQLNKNNK